MNSKERVKAALERRPVDRIPIFMWFHPATAEKLSRLLEIPPSALGDVLGNDVRQAWVNNNYAMEGITHETDGDWHIDLWGIKWGEEPETWSPGIRLLDEWFYFDRPEPRLGLTRLLRFVPLLNRGSSIVQYRLGEQVHRGTTTGCFRSDCVGLTETRGTGT